MQILCSRVPFLKENTTKFNWIVLFSLLLYEVFFPCNKVKILTHFPRTFFFI